jgi:hypothetical protein
LDLLKYPWSQHVFLDHHSTTPAAVAQFDFPILRSRSFALLTDLLLLDLEFNFSANIEVSER